MSANVSNRIEYIDALRGLMIIFVVYCHIIGPALNGFPRLYTSSVNEFIASFRMPLFFFISGFFVYSKNYSLKTFITRSKNRIWRQLYPTIFVCIVFCILFHEGNVIGAIRHPFKYGYWFTITAVELFFLGAPILLVINVNKIIAVKDHTVCLILYTIIVEMIIWLIHRNLSTQWKDIYGTEFIIRYFPFFMGGMIFKMNFYNLLNVFTNKLFALICFLCFVICFYFIDFSFDNFIIGFAAIFLMHFIAYKLYKNDKVANHRISKGLQYIGTMTLEIYLFHYFFIQLIINQRELGHTEWFTNQTNSPWELPLILSLSIIVSLMCLGVVQALKYIKIYNLIFPRLRKSPPTQAINSQ